MISLLTPNVNGNRFWHDPIIEPYTIDMDEQSPKIIFYFEGNTQFIVYSDGQLIDNLLIVTDQETGDWFPVS